MDTYFFEIHPGEIYDIEDLYEEDYIEEQSFDQMLNSNCSDNGIAMLFDQYLNSNYDY